MVIGLLRVRLLAPGCNSLKDKRAILQRTIHRLRSRHNCAVSEIDDHDIWRSIVLGIVTVYHSQALCESLFASVRAEITSCGDFELIEESVEFL